MAPAAGVGATNEAWCRLPRQGPYRRWPGLSAAARRLPPTRIEPEALTVENTKSTSPADAETRIFEAAREVFLQQGYDGARMDEIAKRADANKAMLHYYFRSKRRLFLVVFRATVAQIIPHISALLDGDEPVLDKVDRFVEAYLAVAVENPHLPGFIFEELRRNPDWLVDLVAEHTQGLFSKLSEQIEQAVDDGVLIPIAADQLLVNLLALCAFPFLGRPMLQSLMRVDDAAYEAFLASRAKAVSAFMRQAISREARDATDVT